MTIVIMHQTIAKYDAIGNDIAYLYNLLSKKYNVYVYCEYLFNEYVKEIDHNELNNVIKNKKNVIIYHHSNFWEKGEEILYNACCKIIFRYHNITPEDFFLRFNKEIALKCKRGREQTIRLIENFSNALWMSDSQYNIDELLDVHPGYVAVIPPFNNIDKWKDLYPDENILKTLIEDGFINLLFVGRLAPNKNHLFLIEILNFFVKNYHDKIRLNIIGTCGDDLISYYDAIIFHIKKYKLKNNFFWHGQADENTLLSYFLGCDFFVCASNHEGFCVPVIEAQSLYLPVIAKDTSAISETAGKNQLILSDNIEEYAASIKVLYENDDYLEFLTQNGVQNYTERFTNKVIEEEFKTVFKDFTGQDI